VFQKVCSTENHVFNCRAIVTCVVCISVICLYLSLV